MIIVRLMGGLGNQMFQYALARSIALKNDTNFALDLSILLDRTPNQEFVFRDYDLDIFTCSPKISKTQNLKQFSYYPETFLLKQYYRIIRKLNNPKKIIEKQFNFDKTVLEENSKHILLQGYWQSEKYFLEFSNTIRQDFQFKDTLSEKEQELNQQILMNNAICINFRRADFVTLQQAQKVHGVPSLDYYFKAVQFISSKVENPIFYIFSDDIDWCIKNFQIDFPCIFVTHEYKGRKFSSYLQLMISCKHYIIPNSTFAWWAAWLNTNKDKIVVAPQQWFAKEELQVQTQDLIPKQWIRM